MNKVSYIVYRNPNLYKLAASKDKKDYSKPDSSGKTSKSDSSSTDPSNKKVYTQEEFDTILSNYAAGRTGGVQLDPNAVYENELKKRRSGINVLDSRVHNSALRAKGFNPKLVFGGALLGYGAGALASKLMGFDEDGAWWDKAHRNQLFGISGRPSDTPTGTYDDKFIRSMGAHYSTLDKSAIDSIYSTAKQHGYPQKVEETTSSTGAPAYKVTYGDGSTGTVTLGVGGATQDFKEKGKNPMRWAGYGLRGLGFLLGGAIPYMTSRLALELPYDAASYVHNRYIR